MVESQGNSLILAAHRCCCRPALLLENNGSLLVLTDATRDESPPSLKARALGALVDLLRWVGGGDCRGV